MSELVPATLRNMPPPPRRLSRVLADLARNANGTVTIEQIRQALGDRSFAALLVFFALLNLLPLPPGSTLLLGPPLLLVAVQMVVGSRTVWLPRFLLTKSVTAERFRDMVRRIVPRLRWLERLVRPRYWPLGSRQADRIVGIVALIFATAVTLPIPFGNWFPALTCALAGLALSERDGVLLAVAVACGIFSLLLMGVILGSAGALAGFLFT
jgi:hypothetical protein